MDHEERTNPNLLNDKDWQKLLRNIERGKCILMLGSDIPLDINNTTQPPLTKLFAQYLTEQIADRAKICDPEDLPHVAQNFIAYRVGDRDDLEIEAENFYSDFQQQTTNLHRQLAELPFSYCIATTPDNLMFNAFNVAGKTPSEAFYHFQSGNKALADEANVHSPLVYKLYGTITDSRSLVLTENDLLDFLANIISGCPELPPMLRKLICDKETSFLFIGFGFHRWYLRILLHFFRNQLNHTPPWSLALEDARFFSSPGHEQTALFYDHTHSIEFKNCSWSEFAGELLNRYQQKNLSFKKPPAIVPPSDAPRVFLCHSSKDSEAVGLLGEKLRERGLNTWRDRDNLRGGEDWSRRIKHLINNNQIDYFLVLQTPNMLAETQSYFILEIKYALERQEKNWKEFLFIIPVFLSGNSEQKLGALQHLNYLDLRNDSDLDRLIQDILDDKQKRLERTEAVDVN